MPLFFIIAIGAGAFTLGATTVDVTSDTKAQQRDRLAQTQQVQPQQTYQSMADCQQAPHGPVGLGLPAAGSNDRPNG